LHHLLSSTNDNANAAVTIKTIFFFLGGGVDYYYLPLTQDLLVFFPKSKITKYSSVHIPVLNIFHIPFHRRARKEVLGMLEALIQQ
jgi:hypothetical protein